MSDRTPRTPAEVGGPASAPAAQNATPQTWSVRGLADAIGARLAEAFPTEVWVRGEITDLHRARSGHVYFSLRHVDDDGPDEDGPVDDATGGRSGAGARGRPGDDDAVLAVMLSASARQRVNRLLVRAGDGVRMTDGTEVRIRGRLDWYPPRGTLQLRMSSIDPAFTLGQLALTRTRLLDALRSEGLLDRNARLAVPVPPLRIGLITSAGSAAEADVLHELGASGFAFEVRHADVRVQGPEAPGHVVGALAHIDRVEVDVVLLVHGGGATSDLSAFDDESVARAVAACRHPVITGIGHETDRSVVDEVAHTAAKTPTAAAQRVVGLVSAARDRAEQAWSALSAAAADLLVRRSTELDRATHRLDRATGAAVRHERHRLDTARARLDRATGAALAIETGRLDAARRRIPVAAGHLLDRAGARIDLLATRVAVVDPVRSLARGWSITTTADGTVVRSVADVADDDALRVRVADGTLDVTVTARTPTPPADPIGDDHP